MEPSNAVLTTAEVAERFMTLARQEQWFEIQDELFSDDVKSIEPENSPYMQNAQGKTTVRAKAENFVKRIEAVYAARTGEPVVSEKYFAVSRLVDISLQGMGLVKMDQIMLYEVKDGQIVLEQFFY